MPGRHGYEDFLSGYQGCQRHQKLQNLLPFRCEGWKYQAHQSYSPHGLGWILQNQSGKNSSQPILKQTKLYQPWTMMVSNFSWNSHGIFCFKGRAATGHFSCTSCAGRWASKSLGDSCSPHHTAEWSDVLERVKTATWTACDVNKGSIGWEKMKFQWKTCYPHLFFGACGAHAWLQNLGLFSQKMEKSTRKWVVLHV